MLKTYFDRAQAHNLISLREEIVAMESRMQKDKENYQRMHQELCHNARKAGLCSESLFCPDFQTDSLLSSANPLNSRFGPLEPIGSPAPQSPSAAASSRPNIGAVRDYSRSLLADVPSVQGDMDRMASDTQPGSAQASARAAQQVSQASEALNLLSLAQAAEAAQDSSAYPKAPQK
mgnify:CR=1 FL=1